jgi:hypothetical protein
MPMEHNSSQMRLWGLDECDVPGKGLFMTPVMGNYLMVDFLYKKSNPERLDESHADHFRNADFPLPIRSAERATMNAECSWGAFWYLKSLRIIQ